MMSPETLLVMKQDSDFCSTTNNMVFNNWLLGGIKHYTETYAYCFKSHTHQRANNSSMF